FYESQTQAEQRHIIDAFSFELSKVTVPGIRERTVALLRNVCEPLAQAVAANLGIDPLPAPLPKANAQEVKPEITRSMYLSLRARPGEAGIRTRKVAILTAPGVNGAAVSLVAEALIAKGAEVRLEGQHIGLVPTAEKNQLDVDASFS